jgi:hypothetical protein
MNDIFFIFDSNCIINRKRDVGINKKLNDKNKN